MKQCKNITCWTDYPFTELGDVEGQLAPIRQVAVLAYDGDKYATGRTQCGAIESIKKGYLYRQKTRNEFSKIINPRKIERMCTDYMDVTL